MGAKSDPVEIDTKIAELHKEKFSLEAATDSLEYRIHKMAGDTQHWSRSAGAHVWALTYTDALQKGPVSPGKKEIWQTTLDQIADNGRNLKKIKQQISDLNDVWDSNGRWSRFFLVDNTRGHIHSSMSCSTCYPTTRFSWLPELSGRTEAEAVEEFGGILCSVCFPSAPAEWTEGESKVNKEVREQREEEKRKRDEAKLEKALMPDGQPLRLPDSRSVLKTRHSAEVWLKDSYEDFYHVNAERHRNDREVVLEALQTKTGKTREQIMEEIMKGVSERRRRRK